MRKNRAIRNIFILILAMAAVSLAASWVAPRERVAWRDNYDAAVVESRHSGKPILLYFTANWCGPCQQMKRQTWNDPNVSAAVDRWIPVKIDVDQHPDLARRFGATSIPRLLVLDADQNPVKIRTGFGKANEIVAWLNR